MSGFVLRSLAACSLALFLAGCGGGPAVRTTPYANALPPSDTTTLNGVYEGTTDYRVGPQDQLEIAVFGVPDLTRTVRVNSNGEISLPLVGGIVAGGKTVPELEQLIAESLSKNYLQNPQVTVFVKEYASQRITLEGSFKRPGIYPLTGKTTLLQAMAIAGGFDQMAEPSKVVVFRQVQGKKMAAAFDVRAIRRGDAEDPLVYGDDIVVVGDAAGKSAYQNVMKALPLVGLFFLL
ncbi:polysaccharide biosynthesis/export family protein [Dokdonella immobilis]|nr:polysaccharide biosynthesis/export family protein [Dokdonella immobilis]